MGDWAVLIFIVVACIVLFGGLVLVLQLRNSVLPKYRFKKMFGVPMHAGYLVKDKAIYLTFKYLQQESSSARDYFYQVEKEIQGCESVSVLAKLRKQLERAERIDRLWLVQISRAKRLVENAGDKTLLESIESRLKAEKDTRLSYVS